jgi:hypothetical protein
MLSPKEEKLAENLRLEKKKNVKLEIQIENAEFRVEMEMNHRIQIQNKNHELTYELKEEKAINSDQAEELKRQKEINQALKLEVEKLRKLSLNNKIKMLGTSIFGLLAGFTLKR